MNKRIVNILRIVAFIELSLGTILLSKEIMNFIHLPTVQDIDKQFGGLVDLFKYKESSHKNFFLYSLILFTGLSFWINRKLFWVMTQVLFITLTFVIIVNLWFIDRVLTYVIVFLGILLLFAFINYLGIKMYNHSVTYKMGISKQAKFLSFIGGGLSCAIWLLLQWY